MTTADKIQPPAQKSVYDLALETISNAVQLKDVNLLKNVEARIIERVEDKSLTEQQFQSLGLKLSEAEEAIKAATN